MKQTRAKETLSLESAKRAAERTARAELVRRLHADGMRVSEISERIGVSHTAVARMARGTR